MKEYYRAYAQINLDHIADNIKAMKANINTGTGIIGVVKTDGYGHGAVPVAKTIDPYVRGYAVATLEEGIILRNHGIIKPILILGPTHESGYQKLLMHQISPTIFRLEQAKKLSMLADAAGRVGTVHIAVDTGMSRIGLLPDETSADIVMEISKLPGIQIEGLFTHFAKADETDKLATELQLKKYLFFVSLLKKRGISIPIQHCCNSAGIIDISEANLDMVRAGISIYGLYPSDEVEKSRVVLKPAMELKSFITYKKKIPAGTPVSYGGTFVAEKEMEIATISIGYGDGYPRNLSGKGSVLIHGKRARILGRVCMDQMMVDVTEIKEAKEWDTVTLIGRDGSDCIAVEELAEIGGGFHYEIICNIGKRVPRVYLRNGNTIGTKDYFNDRYTGFTE